MKNTFLRIGFKWEKYHETGKSFEVIFLEYATILLTKYTPCLVMPIAIIRVLSLYPKLNELTNFKTLHIDMFCFAHLNIYNAIVNINRSFYFKQRVKEQLLFIINRILGTVINFVRTSNLSLQKITNTTFLFGISYL